MRKGAENKDLIWFNMINLNMITDGLTVEDAFDEVGRDPEVCQPEKFMHIRLSSVVLIHGVFRYSNAIFSGDNEPNENEIWYC